MSPYRQSAAPIVPSRPTGWKYKLGRALRHINRKLAVVIGRATFGRLKRWRCASCDTRARYATRSRILSELPRICSRCEERNLANVISALKTPLDPDPGEAAEEFMRSTRTFAQHAERISAELDRAINRIKGSHD